MPHSFGLVYVHIVLATRDRQPCLTDVNLRADLHGYMTGILRKLGCASLRIGGVEDHAHVLFRLSRVQSIVRIVEEVRQSSSAWVRRRGMKDFEWHDQYGAFSVSPQDVDRAIRYVENQENHHREVTFADEYREFLRKCDGREHEIDVHLVFSTKNRIPFLADEDLRRDLHSRLETICELVDCPPLGVGGIDDHVHILCRLSPNQTLARLAQEVKKRSSTWLSSRQRISSFDWQDGYGAFSVSPRHVPAVIRYIENQEEHHRQESFQDECRRIAASSPHRPG